MKNEENKKKKVNEKDLETMSGGCGSSKPKSKYRVGDRVRIHIEYRGWNNGTIAEVSPWGEGEFQYRVKFDPDSRLPESYQNKWLLLEREHLYRTTLI